MVYNIEYTEDAANDRSRCVNYLLFGINDGKGDLVVAKKFIKELEQAEKRLSVGASDYALCENPVLSRKGYRKIHLHHYKYKIIYYIEDQTVFIIAILHDLMDYENILS